MATAKPEHPTHLNGAHRRRRSGRTRRIAVVAPFLLPLSGGIDPSAALHATIIGHIAAIVGAATALWPAPTIGIGRWRGRLVTAVTRMPRIGVAATLLIVVGILRVIVVGRSATTLWAIRPLRLFWRISATITTITAIATILWARRVRRIGRARALLATRWRRIGLLIVPLLPLAIRTIYATASGTIVGHAAARRRSLAWLAVLAVVARRLMARVSLLRVWRLLLGALVGGVRLSGTLAGWLVAATWSGLLLWRALGGSAITRRE